MEELIKKEYFPKEIFLIFLFLIAISVFLFLFPPFDFQISEVRGDVSTATATLPSSRKDTAAAFDSSSGKIYIFGGFRLDPTTHNPTYLNEIVQYDPSADTATTTGIGTLPVQLRGASAAYKDADEIYIFGGYDNTNGAFNANIYKFDPSSPSTNAVDTTYDLPQGLKDAPAVYDPNTNKIYIFGGYYLDGSNNPVYSSTIVQFDPATGSATTTGIGTLPVQLRGASAAYKDADEIYIFGGYDNTNGAFNANIYKFDPSSPSTNAVDTTYDLPQGLKDAPAVYAGGKFYIFGGYYGTDTPTYLNEIIEFDSSTGQATTTVDTLPMQLRGASAAFNSSTKNYIFGGYDNTNSQFSDDIIIHTLPNTLPVASLVSIDSGAASVTLTEGTTKDVVCTATVTDDDGYADITSVEAKLYRTGVGAGAVDDNNNHYTLSGDTECVPSNGSGTTEDYTCTFSVYFYADPTDVGSAYEADNWTCQVTPSDSAGAGTADTDTIEMNTLTALDVTATIAYGELALGGNTGTTDQTTTVTNTGNEQIDVQLDGYGATDGDGYAMTCTIGNITIDNERYSLTAATDWSTKTQLTDTATTLTTFDLAKGASSTKDIYWGLGLPSTGVGGSCTGKVNFTAISG